MTSQPRHRATHFEYRVRWRREGSQATYKIFQTKEAAERKADGILALDTMIPHCPGNWVERDTRPMPPLTEKPVIQRRAVSEWEEAPSQITEPSDEACAGMEEWLCPGSQTGVF